MNGTKKNDQFPSRKERVGEYAKINVSTEIRLLLKEIKDKNLFAEFKSLHGKNTVISLWWIFRSIFFSAIAVYLFMISPLFLVLSILLIGRSIRSFGNQCHEVSHNNIFLEPKLNEVIGKYLLMPLLFYDFDVYVKNHIKHHSQLGNNDQDPDIFEIPEQKTLSANRFMAYFQVLKPMLVDGQTYRGSLFGDLFKNFNTTMRILLWWFALATVMTILGGLNLTLNFISLWFITRATFYHFLKVQAEICDHAFMKNSSIIEYSRCMPDNWVSFIFHPENDNYHIAHHLFSGIPMPNLKRAHHLLMCIDDYAKGEHLSTYFGKTGSVINSIVGRSKK